MPKAREDGYRKIEFRRGKMKTIITKELTWHMGHRVPNHKSKCRNPHGHTYKLEAYIEGDVITTAGISDEGMVQDFSDIRRTLTTRVYDLLDHNFMVYDKDKPMVEALGKFQRFEVPFVPTAENIAKWCYEQLKNDIDTNQRQLKGVKLWETPTSTAYYGK